MSNPRTPYIYGLPKTHKEGVPLRPIISGINSAPHRIARKIAETLTPLLGTISDAHLKHSGHLLSKLRDITTTRTKKLASLDVKSLYTNIPVKKCIKRLKEHITSKHIPTPLPIDDFFTLIERCTNLCYFKYNESFYKQKFGLPMGSPLSGALACLYLETLEAGPFQEILPKNSIYLRYIDDTLLICPTRTNIETLTERLNNVDETIQFTFEEEHDGSLPFLDTKIHRTNNGLLFDVYRKPTYKNDLIHYYSHHDNNIKMGMIIGFQLRAIRICSPQYLEKEQQNILNCFSSLKYPKTFIQKAKEKATKIMARQRSEETNKPRLILPTNNLSHAAKQNLTETFQVVSKTSPTIKNLIQRRPKSTKTGNIYKIPCHDCDKEYIGETGRELEKRIREHRQALRKDDQLNAVAQHRTNLNHNINLSNASVIHFEDDPMKRKLIEAAVISQFNTFDQRPGFMNIAEHLSKKLLKNFKIRLKPTKANQ